LNRVFCLNKQKGVAGMASSLRIEYPGAFCHVIRCGNAEFDILESQRDRESFLEYLGKAEVFMN